MSNKESIVILGGTSAVALEYARQKAKQGHSICLVGRKKSVLQSNCSDLINRGAEAAIYIVADLGENEQIPKIWKSICKRVSGIQTVLIAYGVLGSQKESEHNLLSLERNLNVNFNSAAIWSETAFDYFLRQGHGQLTVIGSVAGDRGRQSNYHYGAAKGALDVFVSGLAHRASKTVEAKIGVLLVKPGFIDSPMTDHLDKGGFLWASPEKIATIIEKSENRGRHKVYAPWFWRYILLIIKFLPHAIFKRSSL